MSEQVLEGADGERDVTFRAEGSPFSAMEMHFAAADVARAPIPFEKLWRAVRPLADRFAVSATLDQLGSLVEASPRQNRSLLPGVFQAFPMVGGTWRGMTVHLRLKLAVMFLSADDVAVADVARAVGYGSTEAMARAFRDAALAPPSAIREALRES